MDTVFDIHTSTIIEHFDTLEDPQVERTKLHLLIDIVTLTVCAVICGADGPSDIEEYGHEKHDWLKTFLALPNGIPSHNTIGRVLARIDSQQSKPVFSAGCRRSVSSVGVRLFQLMENTAAFI